MTLPTFISIHDITPDDSPIYNFLVHKSLTKQVISERPLDKISSYIRIIFPLNIFHTFIFFKLTVTS